MYIAGARNLGPVPSRPDPVVSRASAAIRGPFGEPTGHGVDLAGVARACGFTLTGTMREAGEVDAALPIIRSSPGPVLYVAKVRAEPLPFALPPRDGAYLKDRFRHALLGDIR
jgi:hypothetical protein